MSRLKPMEKERQQQMKEQDFARAPVSIKEVTALHPGEWVLMKVTDFDQNKLPSRGHIIAHWTAYNRNISVSLSKMLSSKEPGARYYLFSAHDYARSGAELRKALDGAAREGAVGAWRRW